MKLEVCSFEWESQLLMTFHFNFSYRPIMQRNDTYSSYYVQVSKMTRLSTSRKE